MGLVAQCSYLQTVCVSLRTCSVPAFCVSFVRVFWKESSEVQMLRNQSWQRPELNPPTSSALLVLQCRARLIYQHSPSHQGYTSTAHFWDSSVLTAFRGRKLIWQTQWHVGCNWTGVLSQAANTEMGTESILCFTQLEGNYGNSHLYE